MPFGTDTQTQTHDKDTDTHTPTNMRTKTISRNQVRAAVHTGLTSYILSRNFCRTSNKSNFEGFILRFIS